MRAVVSPTEVAAHNRKLRERQRKLAEVREKEREELAHEVSEFGQTDPGRKLRERYEAKFDAGVKKWLSADPLSREFPTLTIMLHKELGTYQALIRELRGDTDDAEG